MLRNFSNGLILASCVFTTGVFMGCGGEPDPSDDPLATPEALEADIEAQERELREQMGR